MTLLIQIQKLLEYSINRNIVHFNVFQISSDI